MSLATGFRFEAITKKQGLQSAIEKQQERIRVNNFLIIAQPGISKNVE